MGFVAGPAPGIHTNPASYPHQGAKFQGYTIAGLVPNNITDISQKYGGQVLTPRHVHPVTRPLANGKDSKDESEGREVNAVSLVDVECRWRSRSKFLRRLER